MVTREQSTMDGGTVSAPAGEVRRPKLVWEEVKHEELPFLRRCPIRRPGRRSCGYVYIVQAIAGDGLFKIGLTSAGNVNVRLRRIRQQSGGDLRIIAVVWSLDARNLEEWLGRQFWGKRVRGEWFALTEDDIALIMEREPEVEP